MAQQRSIEDTQQEHRATVVAVVCSAYVRKHLSQVIDRDGVDVFSFGYLKDAMEYLKGHEVDLVVLDPDCCNSGFTEAVRIIRNISMRTTIAGLVGWWDKRKDDLGREHICLLSRPIEPEEIDELLKEIILSRQADMPHEPEIQHSERRTTR